MAKDTETDDKMYTLVCKGRFDSIDKKQDQIIDLLRGKNNQPGLVDEIRVLKARWKIIFGSLAVLFAALATNLVKWLLSIL